MEHFPLPTPRWSQEEVLKRIQNIIEKEDKKFIILEAPVGSGKSAIAITVARWLGNAHVLTPLKSLQNQYYHDFMKHITLMKGRNSYPCTYETLNHEFHSKVIQDIEDKKIIWLGTHDKTCAEGPCKDDEQAWHDCKEEMGVCPYTAAMRVAMDSSIVVHNFHSFIFQAHFNGKFDERELLVIDEAHVAENMLREFTVKKVTIHRALGLDEEPGEFTTLGEWTDYFMQERFIPKKDTYTEKEEAYMNQVGTLSLCADNDSWKKFVVKRHDNLRPVYTKFEFVPESLGSIAHTLLFNYGKRVLIMSGTIYSKARFCANLGIPESQASFIRIDSSFPVEGRPIYMKPEYACNTAHVSWKEEIKEIAEKCNTLLDKFNDVKGLIHVPSYNAGAELFHAMKNKRLVLHGPADFQSSLETFYKTKGNKVFVSPTCQQGVDFKDDRARFQIILRVPYLNTGDEFIKHKLKKDYSWYNYHALVIFGQQIGRINRSEKDFGATILLDSRFPDFIRKNSSLLPRWLTDAIKR